jgi:hypothetical protein
LVVKREGKQEKAGKSQKKAAKRQQKGNKSSKTSGEGREKAGKYIQQKDKNKAGKIQEKTEKGRKKAGKNRKRENGGKRGEMVGCSIYVGYVYFCVRIMNQPWRSGLGMVFLVFRNIASHSVYLKILWNRVLEKTTETTRIKKERQSTWYSSTYSTDRILYSFLPSKFLFIFLFFYLNRSHNRYDNISLKLQ